MKVDFDYNELIGICFLFEITDKEYIKFGKHHQHVLLGEFKSKILNNIKLKKYELDLDRHLSIELSNIILDGINISGSKNMFNLSEQGIDIYNKLTKIISQTIKYNDI